MKAANERILLVESDAQISDLVARQTLQALGFHVETARSAAAAIQAAARLPPDLIIADMHLPDLSGKDLLVALTAQGWDIPFIVIGQKGQEMELIQAFRLGAVDYLLWPAREGEIAASVERVIKQVRARQERADLENQLKQANSQLQRRVRELTTLFAIGKAVTSITRPKRLFEKLVEGSLYVVEADLGYLLLRQDDEIAAAPSFTLSAQKNLPLALAERINQPWNDGLSALVALSGEALAIHGEALRRFKIAQLGQSALAVPIKVKQETAGLLIALRKALKPFTQPEKALLEAVADYASIALVNVRLFSALEARAQGLQAAVEAAQAGAPGEEAVQRRLRSELKEKLAQTAALLQEALQARPPLSANQAQPLRQALATIQQAQERLLQTGGDSPR